MSKRNSAPTLGWLVSSNINRYIVIIFFIQVTILAFYIYGIKYHLDRSCYNTYERDISIFGYDISLNANHDVEACLDGS